MYFNPSCLQPLHINLTCNVKLNKYATYSGLKSDQRLEDAMCEENVCIYFRVDFFLYTRYIIERMYDSIF